MSDASPQRATRLVFADTLFAGQTVIVSCGGGLLTCPLAVNHPPGAHDLTILDIRQAIERVIAIAVEARSGEQVAFIRGASEVLRIYVDVEQTPGIPNRIKPEGSP